jgi:FkbM family methyltransferase
MPTPIEQPYGHHAPDGRTQFLRSLVKLGVARGQLTKQIRKRWMAVHGPMVDAEIRGIHYRLDLSNNATDNKVLLSSKEYDRVELNALADTARGGAFVDIGANMGYYTLNLIKRGANRVVAVEPNPPSLHRLRFNLSINGFEDRVMIIPEGVGPDGELELYQTEGLGSASFVRPNNDVPTLKVRTRPLLAILAQAKVDAIGGLKIDVEGFEDRVLIPFLEEAPEGLLPATVVMESCHGDVWETDLPALFYRKGYQLKAKTRANLIFRKAQISQN